eukprot:TRINITY_DN4747_c0_g1_i1.p1 TRINITY_DN4747_c0_g1~~TRINITY_DN4747_c0_g1_i1.p1  ORF type:complete len:1245 (+),score=238.58 TRINITY_DN4747_c0_g1_i1:39-3773(+)
MAPKRSESSQSGKMKEPLMKLSEKFPDVSTKELTKVLADAKNDIASAEEELKKAGHKASASQKSKRASSPAGSKSATPVSKKSNSPSPSKSSKKSSPPTAKNSKVSSSAASKTNAPAAPKSTVSNASQPPPPAPEPTPPEETEEEKEQKSTIKKLVLETNKPVEACGDALRLAGWDLKKAQAILEMGDKMDKDTDILKLRRYFAKHKPSAASQEETEKFRKRWEGAEDQMWKILIETYGEPPNDTEADTLLANLNSAPSQLSAFPEGVAPSRHGSVDPSRHGSLPGLSTGLPPPPVHQSTGPVPASIPSQAQYQHYDSPQQSPSTHLHTSGYGQGYQGVSMPSASPVNESVPGVQFSASPTMDSTLQPPQYAQNTAFAPQGAQGFQNMTGGGIPGVMPQAIPGMPPGMPGFLPPGDPQWMLQAPWLLPGLMQPLGKSRTSVTDSETTEYEEEEVPKNTIQLRRNSQSPPKRTLSAFSKPIPERSGETEQIILDKIKDIEEALLAVAPAKEVKTEVSQLSVPASVADLPPPPPPPPPLPETPVLSSLPNPTQQIFHETQAIQARTKATADLTRRLKKDNASKETVTVGPPTGHRTEPGGPLLYGLPGDEASVRDTEGPKEFLPMSALGGALSTFAGVNVGTDMTENYKLLLNKQQDLLSRTQDQGDKAKIRALEKELVQMQQRFVEAQRHQAEQLEVIGSIQQQIEVDSRLTKGSINHLEGLTTGVQEWATKVYEQQQDYLDTKTMQLKREAVEHQESMAQLANMHKPADIAVLARKQQEILEKTKYLAKQRAQLLQDPLRQADMLSEASDIESSLKQSHARQRQYESTLLNLTSMMASGMESMNASIRREPSPPPPPPSGPPPPPPPPQYQEPISYPQVQQHIPVQPLPVNTQPPPSAQPAFLPVHALPEQPAPPPPPPPPPLAQPVHVYQAPAPQYPVYESSPPSESAQEAVIGEIGTLKEVLKLLVKHQVEQSAQQEDLIKQQGLMLEKHELNELNDARRHTALLEGAAQNAAMQSSAVAQRSSSRPVTPSQKTRSKGRHARPDSPKPSPRRRSLSKSSPSRRLAEDALNMTAPKSPRSANIQQSLYSISEAVQQLKTGAYRNSSVTPSALATPAPTVTTVPTATPISVVKVQIKQDHRPLPPPENPHRAVLVKFYERHDPVKLKDVDTILERFSGHDNTLFHSLAKKYNIKCSPYRDQLISFYSKYNPAKLCEVDIILHLAEGREEKLLRSLEAKYIRGEM